ncbi:MAG: fused MFS/spermidine synthase [Planctomycetota bacterium]
MTSNTGTGVQRWGWPALAFLTGTAVMVFEFAAPNLFRAYFGQTIYVWANVIGVILAALAAGYALGGRWADATDSVVPLVVVIGFAGVYGMLVAWLGPALCAWLAGPEEYTPDGALRAFFAQSLAASVVLFGPPLVALGMATPLMVKRASKHWPVGRASGLIFSVGTVGSLCGIYLTTFVLVELLGVRATIRVGSGALVVLAAALLFARTRARNSRAAAGALAISALLPAGFAAPWDALPPEGSKLVLAFESPYQLIRVVDRPPSEEHGQERWLAFDEGMGTYHSMQVTGESPWTGAYYDAFAYLPAWVGAIEKARFCIVGNAAGTMVDQLLHHNPTTAIEIDTIEIDPMVTEAARRTMGLRDKPGVRVFHEDGRTFLIRAKPNSYDAILMDAYARQVSIPAALATKEFFALAKSRLKKNGILFVNLGTLRPGGELVQTICDTLHAGFGGPVYRAPLERTQNVLLVAARSGPAPAPPAQTRLGVVWSFGRHVPGKRILTDDFCPVESITARDLLLER